MHLRVMMFEPMYSMISAAWRTRDAAWCSATCLLCSLPRRLSGLFGRRFLFDLEEKIEQGLYSPGTPLAGGGTINFEPTPEKAV